MDAEAAPVIAAFSPSISSRDPLNFAIAASEVTRAPLIVVHVRIGGPVVSAIGAGVDDSMGDDARGLEHLRVDLARQKVPVSIEVVDSRTVFGGLRRAIEKHRPQLVVLGSSTRSAMGSVLMGGTAEKIVHEAACPVAVVPVGYKRPDQGVQLVGDLHAEFDVLAGDPGDALIGASRHVDLLVMGARGRGARRAAVLGSVSRKVAGGAACPLLILPRGAGETSRQLASSVEARGAD